MIRCALTGEQCNSEGNGAPGRRALRDKGCQKFFDFSDVDFEIQEFPDNYEEVQKYMNAKRAAKLLEIARYYGEEKQVCKLMEELGEAVSAASEVLMLLSFHEQGGKKRDLEARLEHLAAELADVFNVAEQVIALFGLETDFKVARHAGVQKTLKRIREEEQADEVRNEPARLDF